MINQPLKGHKSKKMETKKSVVNKVIHNARQFHANGTTYYVHKISFENGDNGDYNSKSETCKKFQEGKEEEYTIDKGDGKYAPKIKPIQEKQQSGNRFQPQPKNEKLILAQTCIKSACELNARDTHLKSMQSSIEQVLEDAEKMFNWCIEKSK